VLIAAVIHVATLAVALHTPPVARPAARVAQDTTHRDTAGGAIVTPKKKGHTAAYNVGHATTKAATDTKNAVVTAGTNVGHEAQRAAKNTRNETHRDADKVSKATGKSKKELKSDSAKRAAHDSAAAGAPR
jgi:hypothetical protein